LLAAACQARQPQPEYQTTATIKDIMDSMVDPNADYLWESVAAHGLHDAVLPALKAIEEKDVKGLSDAGEKIDTACENCHLKYWYPNQFAALNKPANDKK
jgi:cytochrome c556